MTAFQREFGFDVQLAMSHGTSASKNVEDILLANIPGAARAYKSTSQEDRNGTDWWVKLRNGDPLAVDCKVRAEDFAAKRGEDDLALETWSVVEKGIVGWTRDPQKRCDYVLWLWQDTGRWCLIPFPMLCMVFMERWQEWAKAHRTRQQITKRARDSYHSECVFVPRRAVWAAIYQRFSGHLAAPIPPEM